jgi:hypothetical protein
MDATSARCPLCSGDLFLAKTLTPYEGRRDPYRDYRNDPMFAALVDSIVAMLARADFSPAEVRQAAVVACTEFDARFRAPAPHAAWKPKGTR